MTILKCMVGLNDGYVIIIDGIEHDNKLWIIPGWLESTSEPIAIPKRMIRFDNHRHQSDNDPQSSIDYLNIILPIAESQLLRSLPVNIEHIDKPQNVRIPIYELRRQ